MNKYQEALNFLDWYCDVEHKEEQDLLQELVDKATPIKPIENILGTGKYIITYTHECSECGNYLESTDKYCSECGSEIEWSEQE